MDEPRVTIYPLAVMGIRKRTVRTPYLVVKPAIAPIYGKQSAAASPAAAANMNPEGRPG